MVLEGIKDKEWSGQGTMFTPHVYIDQVYVTLCSFGGADYTALMSDSNEKLCRLVSEFGRLCERKE